MRNKYQEALVVFSCHFTVVTLLLVVPPLELLQSGLSFFYAHNWVGWRFFVWFFTLFTSLFFLWSVAFEIIFRALNIFFKSVTRIGLVRISILSLIVVNSSKYISGFFSVLLFFVFSLIMVKVLFSDRLPLNEVSFVSAIIASLSLSLLIYQLNPIYLISDIDDNRQVMDWNPKVKNVFLIIYDEFPTIYFEEPDGLGLSKTLLPNIATFGSNSTYYPLTRTVSTNTVRAIPSILTGRKPIDVQPTAPNYPNSLFTLLSNTYDVVGYEPYTRLCPSSICTRPSPPLEYSATDGQSFLRKIFWSQNLIGFFDSAILVINSVLPEVLIPSFIPQLDGRWGNFANISQKTLSGGDFSQWAKLSTEQRMSQPVFNSLLERKANPTFWFLHWNLPHAHEYYPNGDIYLRSNEYLLDNPHKNRFLEDVRIQQMLLQFKFMDAQFGNFIQQLKSLGIWKDSLIVLTSDHGMSLTGDRRGQDFRSSDSPNQAYSSWIRTLYVPLLIKYPGQETGYVDNRLVSTLDIVPTILDVIDYPNAQSLLADGQSLTISSDGWKATPTFWDQYLAATAEELGINIDKPNPVFRLPYRLKGSKRPENFSDYVFENSIGAIKDLQWSSEPLKVRFALGKPAFSNSFDWNFIDGSVSSDNAFPENSGILLTTRNSECGLLAVYPSDSSYNFEGFLSRKCRGAFIAGTLKATLLSENNLAFPLRYTVVN